MKKELFFIIYPKNSIPLILPDPAHPVFLSKNRCEGNSSFSKNF
jgi:hypothetical protein